jgi:Flp pilus assembly protein TadB
MGRATAKVLAVMPAAFVVVLSVINRGYMLPFVRSDLGHLLLAYSAVSIAVGFVVLNRLVNVDD